MRNRLILIVGAVILLLWLLNPTYKAFKEHAPERRGVIEYMADNKLGLSMGKDISYRRRTNYIICSVYTVEFTVVNPTVERHTIVYLGALGNFWRLAPERR